MTGTPLRRRLFVLIATAIVPLAIMAALGLYILERQQYEQTGQVGLELSRSVATAVDTELRSATSSLEALATTTALDVHDLVEFRERAQRLLAIRPEWAAITLADTTGTIVLDTRAAPGSAPSPAADRESFDRVVQTRRSATGSLTRESQGWLFPVRVPVIRHGTLMRVITALVKPEAIGRLLTVQDVPSGWIISITDKHGHRVARTSDDDGAIGGPLPATVQQVVEAGTAEGLGLAYTPAGERIFAPYCRLGSSGWLTVLGIPTAQADAAVYRSLAVYGGGVLLSLALGMLGALWVGRSITRPMSGLRIAAEALGHNEAPPSLDTSIDEIQRVGAALKVAAEDLRAAEAERDDLLRKERQAREAAEAADSAKDAFMAVLSHELRTPLNAVYGWARMLRSGRIHDPALVERAQDAIVRNTDIQLRLIDDLLDLARIRSGKMPLNPRPINVRDEVLAALEVVRPAADDKSIDIQVDLDPDANALTADPARVEQIVWNLLTNAVRFTPAGGRVRLHTRRVDSAVRIVISDTGKGIAPDMLPHVFERFRQADNSSTREHGGLGLGLALVKHLVELHGGRVTAESEGENLGATFTVTLPMTAVNAPAVEASAKPTPPATGRLDGLRVLIVDDATEAAALTEAVLMQAGARVHSCQAAADAFDFLCRWRPDVLVSDIEMPGEDGYSLIRRVRALPVEDGGQTPAIALTAYGNQHDRARSLAAGFTRHIAKPVSPEALSEVIADAARGMETPRAS